jgi:hypothetical protein
MISDERVLYKSTYFSKGYSKYFTIQYSYSRPWATEVRVMLDEGGVKMLTEINLLCYV